MSLESLELHVVIKFKKTPDTIPHIWDWKYFNRSCQSRRINPLLAAYTLSISRLESSKWNREAPSFHVNCNKSSIGCKKNCNRIWKFATRNRK